MKFFLYLFTFTGSFAGCNGHRRDSPLLCCYINWRHRRQCEQCARQQAATAEQRAGRRHETPLHLVQVRTFCYLVFTFYILHFAFYISLTNKLSLGYVWPLLQYPFVQLLITSFFFHSFSIFPRDLAVDCARSTVCVSIVACVGDDVHDGGPFFDTALIGEVSTVLSSNCRVYFFISVLLSRRRSCRYTSCLYTCAHCLFIIL